MRTDLNIEVSSQASDDVACHEFLCGDLDGPRLLVRRRVGEGASVLFVHGATFPSECSIAYAIGGSSWMDDLQQRGFDVWAFDFAGYGGSERQASFLDGDADAAPYGGAEDAARQIRRVLRLISKQTGRRRVDLLAHSWGTIPTSIVATDGQTLVDRLILYGPVVTRATKVEPTVKGPSLPVSISDQRHAFAAGTPDGLPNMEPAEFDRWSATYLGTDPGALLRSPPCVHVPSGPALDIQVARGGFAAYNPAAIACPTLIVRGEWDTVATAGDVASLTAAMVSASGGVEVATLAKGGHRMHLERNRAALFDCVGEFLRRRTGGSCT